MSQSLGPKRFPLLLGTLLPLIILLDFGTAFLLLCVACWQFEHHPAVTPAPLHAELVMRGAGPCGQWLLQWWWLALLVRQRAVVHGGVCARVQKRACAL